MSIEYGHIPLRHGGQRISNKTSLGRRNNGAGVALNCPVCGIGFSLPPSHARRHNSHCCSRGCAAKHREITIEKPCMICGKTMLVKPHSLDKLSCCSKVCSHERRKRQIKHGLCAGRPQAFIAYKHAVKQFVEAAQRTCARCGGAEGPWVVEGAFVETKAGELPVADTSKGVLVCRPCHMRKVNPFYKESL